MRSPPQVSTSQSTGLRATLGELAGVTLDQLSDMVICVDDFCCLGATMGRCTCWRPEHDHDQAELQHGPPAIRRVMCRDCAWRGDSPERSGDERYANTGEEALESIGYSDQVFYCHQGMRQRLAQVHGPSGARVVPELRDVDYDPPQRGALAFKASGAPADICAGFATRARTKGGRR